MLMEGTEELRSQVLEACHALAAYGLGPGIGGHVSARIPGEEKYWVNVLDRCFEEMTLEDIVLMDFEGNVLEAARPISPGIGFHPGIYRLRPDVGAVVHTHGYWVTAQSAYARPPKPWHNLSTYFHGRTAVAPDDEIELIAPALGEDDIAIVIPWHGAITIGKDIPEAAALHVTFDYACRLDVLLAESSAPPMPDEHGRTVQKLLAQANYLELTWDLMRRKAARAHNGETVVPLVAA
jgi:ribulose-5-phosphate 4-epimerase/fuculose-1-phosphate aldolase